MRNVIRKVMNKKTAGAYIADWTSAHIGGADAARFVEVVETELMGLHEGSFARYRVLPSEYASWRKAWGWLSGAWGRAAVNVFQLAGGYGTNRCHPGRLGLDSPNKGRR